MHVAKAASAPSDEPVRARSAAQVSSCWAAQFSIRWMMSLHDESRQHPSTAEPQRALTQEPQLVVTPENRQCPP